VSARTQGLIVCGPLAPATLDPRAFATAIHTLSQHLGWPVIAEPASGLRFADLDHSLLITDSSALLRHPSTRELLQPACILQFGQNPTSKIVSHWLGALPAECERVMIDPDGMWHDPHASASTLIVCDPISLCQNLSERIRKRAGRAAWPPATAASEWTRAWLERAAVTREVLSQHTQEGLWEGRVAAELAHALPRHSQLWTASSMPVRNIDHFTGARQEDLAVRANRGTNGIDGTIASATGAAQVWPHGSTVALLGDLAFLHDLGGLQAAAQLDAQLTLVVINNGGGGIFSFLPIANLESSRFERLFLTPQSGDISQICGAVGAVHERVDEADSLGAALQRHIGHRGLRIVEVMVDRADNVRRHERAWTHVIRALDEVSAKHIKSAPNATPAIVPEGPS
jgi:2-succinyl-5-enolpyruvyl-6-hydroxy-3-cyclohexene-1-carboxylate synthase